MINDPIVSVRLLVVYLSKSINILGKFNAQFFHFPSSLTCL